MDKQKGNEQFNKTGTALLTSPWAMPSSSKGRKRSSGMVQAASKAVCILDDQTDKQVIPFLIDDKGLMRIVRRTLSRHG